MRFHDKIAIVTGGASGIGKEVATRFVAEGGLVVINGRDRAKAEAAVREIDPKGRRAVVHVGDIALPATGEAVVKTAIDRFGRLDVLFNNAGMFTPKPFLQVDEVEYDRFVDVIQVITVSLPDGDVVHSVPKETAPARPRAVLIWERRFLTLSAGFALGLFVFSVSPVRDQMTKTP